MTIKWVKWVGNAYSLWCQHFLGKKKKMTFTHTGQDKTQKKNEKWKQMNRERGSKKQQQSIIQHYCNIQDSRIAWLHVDICFQSKCFLLGDIYIYLNKLENGWPYLPEWGPRPVDDSVWLTKGNQIKARIFRSSGK